MTPSGGSAKPRPLTLSPCNHLPNFPRFLRQVQAIDVSTTALFEQNYPRICHDLGGVPTNDIATADRTKLPPVHPLPDRHRMPYRSLGDKFVGRVDAIWNLTTRYSATAPPFFTAWASLPAPEAWAKHS